MAIEFLFVIVLAVALLPIALGKTIWLWIGLLFAAMVVGYRAYRIKCKVCGRKVISGREMKFCNQCGAIQERKRWIHLRCQSCRRMARSELNINFCNLCGAEVNSAG